MNKKKILTLTRLEEAFKRMDTVKIFYITYKLIKNHDGFITTHDLVKVFGNDLPLNLSNDYWEDLLKDFCEKCAPQVFYSIYLVKF